MKPIIICVAAISVILCTALLTSCTSRKAAAGPSGGDVVPIQSGATNAEVVTSADTGEVMVYTWDQGLKNRKPIDIQPMTLGSGAESVQLEPFPVASDPAGRCSRFYGQANWVRAGKFDHGWLQCCGGQGTRQDFAWSHCWSAGRGHQEMWTDMGSHRRGPTVGGPMGPGMGGHP
jgi:hypothetical protein